MTRNDTDRLKALVARHFSEPEWFTTFELPIFGAVETEDGKDRLLDALAVSRVASRSNELIGVEVKTDRADWLKELASPLKAEAWIRLVDRWYVAASKGVVKRQELPPGWGFLEESGSGLRRVVQATLSNPWRENGDHDPIPRELWVRILRRTLGGEATKAREDAAYTRGHEAGVKEANEDRHRTERDVYDRFRGLVETVQAFEKASGIRLVVEGKMPDGTKHVRAEGRWSGERLGEAVKVVIEHKDFVRYAAQHLSSFERNTRDLRKALEEAGWKPENDDP